MLKRASLLNVAAIGLTLATLQPAKAQENALAAENFQQADANGDGALEYAEFVKFIDLNAADELGRATIISSRELHARAFDRLNTNGDETISPEELQQLSD